MRRTFFIFICCALSIITYGNGIKVDGIVKDNDGAPIVMAQVVLQGTSHAVETDHNGYFSIQNLEKGTYRLSVFSHGFELYDKKITIDGVPIKVDVTLKNKTHQLREFTIQEQKINDFGITHLNSIEGTAIYASKKNEVIIMEDVAANLATNNSRQVYSKITGLNIWESDAAGLQLGVGGRGLSPNRTSNFNTRQNGYDISADALGYPESYYSPPSEAVERIEVIRGAASLQYGTQFGGVLNFILKQGSKTKPFEATIRQTAGSFGLLNTFVSVGGTKNATSYYGFVQHKQGDGWRENSGFNSNSAFFSGSRQITKKLKLGAEFTHLSYLAQQAGGVTDKQFAINPRISTRDRNWFEVTWNLGAVLLDYELSHQTKLNSRTFGLLASRNALGELGRIDRPDPLKERDLISGTFSNFGNETRILHRYKLIKELPSALLVGVRYYQGQTTSQQGDADDGYGANFNYLDPNNLDSDYLFDNRNVSFFTENVFKISKQISVTPGVRYEHITTEASGVYNADIKHPLTDATLIKIDSSEQKSSSRNIVLFGIGGSIKPTQNIETYANFSQNYRAINFSDIKIVNPNFRVNENILDENGYNFDIGLRGNIKNYLTFDVTLFYLRYNNRIGSVLKKDTITFQNYRYRTNVGNARNKGIEFFSELDLLKVFSPDTIPYGWSIFSNTAIIDAEYISSEDASIKEGNRVELVPTYNIKSGTSFRYKNFKLTYQYTYVSEQYTEATNAIVPVVTAIDGLIPSYSVMDLSASYPYKRYRLETGINNLANNTYFTRRATAYPGPGIIPSDGRNFYVTIQVKL